MSDLIERLRFAYRTSHGAPSILTEAADEIERLRGALADIAFSDDMTLEVARSKAKRIYEENAAPQATDTPSKRVGSGGDRIASRPAVAALEHYIGCLADQVWESMGKNERQQVRRQIVHVFGMLKGEPPPQRGSP